jgi:hypothetical protein
VNAAGVLARIKRQAARSFGLTISRQFRLISGHAGGGVGSGETGPAGKKVFGKGFDRKLPIRYIFNLFVRREE